MINLSKCSHSQVIGKYIRADLNLQNVRLSSMQLRLSNQIGSAIAPLARQVCELA